MTQEIIPQGDFVKENWYSCYGKPWPKGSVSLETFSHPAKFSRALIRRIYKHLLDEKLIAPGDTILDCFGGAALGACDALANGLNWQGIELEQKFVDMGAGCDCTGMSKADWVRFYDRWERANWKEGRHWCPRCLSEARQVKPPGSSQLALFGQATPSASYVRNSGRIPHTDAHHYVGNLELFGRYAKGGAVAVLMQGDSRNLLGVLQGAGLVPSGDCQGLMSSPPYSGSRIQQEGSDNGANMRRSNDTGAYGSTPGQLAALPEGGLDALISSSPYANGEKGHPSLGSVNKDNWGNEGTDIAGRRGVNGDYGQSGGQLANLPEGNLDALVSSPMFAGNSGGRGEASREGIDAALFDRHSGGMIGGLEGSEGNIGGLPMRGFEAVVSSPPYADMVKGGEGPGARSPEWVEEHRNNYNIAERDNAGTRINYGSTNGQLGAMPEVRINGGFDYGNSNGQLGQDSGETFWAAAKTIISEAYLALAPGAVAAWVCKDFVQSGLRKPFCAQWRMLCEAVGFEYMYTIRAWQVDRKGRQGKLEGGEVELKTEFKSFFRRLHEAKPGAERIDWEEVIFLRKPGRV